MRVEHKLPPAVRAYAQRTVEQLSQIRAQYLTALGHAKELEVAAETIRQALSQQLALVEEAAGLPKPVAPYQLNTDATALVGEIADQALAPAEPRPSAPAVVNGALQVEDHA